MTMAIEALEKLALDLPEEQRAQLAASLLDSLPGVLADTDEGVAEALRRNEELNQSPEQSLTLEQLDSQIRNRR